MPSNLTVWTQGVICKISAFIRNADCPEAVSSLGCVTFSDCDPIPKSLNLSGYPKNLA